MRAKARNFLPLWARDDGTNCAALKHHFRYDAIVGGNIVDWKGGVVAQPQSGYAFVQDTDRGAIRSSAMYGSAPTIALASGAWETLAAGKFMLMLHSGFVIDEFQPDPTYEIPYSRTMRFAIGNNNNPDYFGAFGLSDGASSRVDPWVIGGGWNHAVIKDLAGNYVQSDVDAGSTVSAADDVYSVLGTSGVFVRYGLYRPDTQSLEVAIYDTDGNEIKRNDFVSNIGDPLGEISFSSQFRMHGWYGQGAAIFHLDAYPTDVVEACVFMADKWARGHRNVIWPFWS